MFKLSYSLNSANLLPVEEVCDDLLRYGFSGVELSFQRGQFDPHAVTEDRARELRDYFSSSGIKPACISTATTKFLSDVPHEPSLINVSERNRALRADLIRLGIVLAEKIGIPLVSFQSGYLRDEHGGMARADILRILAGEITGLLGHIRGDVNLVLEPEPGMFIETLADARELIALVADPRFGLHMDIGHVFCTEEDYLHAIETAAPEARYVHMADIREGFNLKFATARTAEVVGLLARPASEDPATLYDIDESGVYLFIDGSRKLFIAGEGARAKAAGLSAGPETLIIDRTHIRQNETSDLKHEILAYLDSVSGVEYERVLRAYDAIASLRLGNGRQPGVIADTVCNTVNGKVHYHDLFGNGNIDYAGTISALIRGGYTGYCTVELYNHAPLWRDIAPRSAKFILSHVLGHSGWDPSRFGHIDHRTVTAPYLRAADAQMGPEGGVGVLYDLRLAQPNTEPLAAEVLHSLEHCLLFLLPGLVPGFLGVGPMGCQTGLYLTTAYPLDRAFMIRAVVTALERILELDEVPYRTEALCGMARTHDLAGAKTLARSALPGLAHSIN